MKRFAELFMRGRVLVGCILAAITLAAAYGYVGSHGGGHPMEKYEIRLSPDEADIAWQVAGELDLARSDAFLVVDGGDLFRPETMAALREVAEAVEALPIVEQYFWVDRIPTLNVFGFVDPLIPAADAPRQAFEDARARVASNALASQLVSDDGDAMMAPIVYDWLALEDDSDRQLVDQVLNTARDVLQRHDVDLRVRLTGRIPLFAAQRTAFDRNQIIFQTIGYVMAFVLAAVMFRGVAAVIIVSAAPMLAVFWALGLVRLLALPANPLAEIVMPVLVSMIGLTDGVHLLVHIRRARLGGMTPMEASQSAIEKVGVACLLTSLTTAIGFAALLTASSDYVKDFGLVCCLGVLLAFVAVVGFVPLVSSTRWGRTIHQGEDRDILGKYVSKLEWVISFSLAHRWQFAVVSVLVTTALVGASLTLRPDNRLAAAMPTSSEAYQALAFCDDHFGGIEFFAIEMNWSDAWRSDDPRLLAALRDVEALVDGEPLVSRPLSVRTMLASFPGDPNDLETQITFLSLLPSDLRDSFFDARARQARVSVRMQDKGIARYTPIFDRLEGDLAEIAERYPGVEFSLTGTPVNVSRDLYQIVRDLQVSLLTASVVILIVLAVVYRSARVGLISIVPNLFPLAATGAWLTVTAGTLDMSSVCAFVVCLGIAVDDTIHFLSRFFQELEVGDGGDQASVDAAIRRAFVKVGGAMLMTTIILVTGFGAVLLSDLPGHRTFGGMACFTITAALIGDLIALPALLSCFFRRRRSSIAPSSRG